MTNQEMRKLEALKAAYARTDRTELDELKALDKKVKRPANVTAYSVGTAGALVLGTGMCLAMKVIGNSMLLGVGIGVVGIALVTVNYFLYKKILKSRKNKYAKEMVRRADSLLNK